MNYWKFLASSLLIAMFTVVLGCEDFEDPYESTSGQGMDLRAGDVCSAASGGNCVTYEAEKRTAASGCNVATNHGGFTGTGFMDFGGNGTWIEWNNIFAEVEGEYTLTFRYANGSSSNRQAALLLNGSQITNIPFAPKGGWSSWNTVTHKLSLRKGNNTIRIKANTGSGGPNLDNMTVEGKEAVVGGGDYCAVAGENSVASLSCNSGLKIVSIDFASYGLPNGSCDSNFSLNSACHASSSKAKVEAACLNKQSCSISANNSIFGDPCSGKYKKLAIVFSCGGSGQTSDQCPGDPSKTEPGQCGCGVPEGTCNNSGEIKHVGTTQVWDADGQNINIARPSGARAGDLLILALHRTDDDLPLYVDGWTRVAECYKRDNGYDCSTESDCKSWHNDDFCGDFGGHGGHDLAQSIFFKRAGSSEPGSYRFNMNRDSTGHPGWIILTALRGADTSNPVRDWSFKGCDANPDSAFPSVYGHKGDMVLLSQSFDDQIAQAKFGAPAGTVTFGYVSNSDEAGFLFGGVLSSTGYTGIMKTQGDGGPNCKDALVSLTIKPQ